MADVQNIHGQISGSNGPISIDLYTVQDFNANILSRPLLSDTIQPSSDGSYQYRFDIDPVRFTRGEYVAVVSLPTGQSARVTFLVKESQDISSGGDGWVGIPPGVLIQKGESREALAQAADDLQKGNTTWLVAAMPLEVQEQVGKQPAISAEDAAEIANALGNAKEVEMKENFMIYETTYRGAPHTFYTVKEWGVWKIVGF